LPGSCERRGSWQGGSRWEVTPAVGVIGDIGVTVHPATVDRLEHAARTMPGMYDALVVQLARELDLPLLVGDAKLSRAVDGTVQVEVLQPTPR
jgi:hypothetical protein